MNFTDEEEKMLLDLFHLYGPSHGEKPILDFIKNFLDKYNIHYEQDKNGNIYCLNHKDQPLLSAHTDCVGTAIAGQYVNLIDIYQWGKERIMKGVGNIGGDDKCGVFLILLYLKSGKPINAVFSICEEIGGSDGINTLLSEIKDDEIFKSIPYCIVLDRKHAGDIICNQNDYGTLEFQNELEKIGKDYGYAPVKGGSSDMNKISSYMNGCNLSTAYYNPHSNHEFVVLGELYNTWNYLNALIEKMPRNLPMKKPVVAQTPNYSGYGYNGTHYSYWENGKWKQGDYSSVWDY